MVTSEELATCVGCGAPVADISGAGHAYLGASPGCYALFSEVLAREYTDFRYAAVHNLTVDAYALQHPGTPSPQTIQSAAVHLISLYLQLAHDFNSRQGARAKQIAVQHSDRFWWLEPPALPGALTILDVHRARDAASHRDIVTHWAGDVWNSWSDHHATVRAWARETGLA